MIFLIVFLISYLIALWMRKDNKLPPGPIGLPIVGYYPFIVSDPLVKIQKLAEKYPSIMRLNLLGEDMYVLNSFEAVNEALVINGDTFSGRPAMEFSLFNEVHGEKGFQNLEGEDWRIQQKFYMGKLAGLGMGKSDFALRIHELCDDLIGYISQREQHNDLIMLLSNFTSNTISLLLTNKKYKPDDPNYIALTDHVNNLNHTFPGLYFYLYGSVGNFLVTAQKRLWNVFKDEKKITFEMIFDRLKKRLEAGDGSDCSDVLDYCIQKRNKDNAEFFDDETLVINFYLMFAAGTDTTSTTLNYGLNLMAAHRNVQQKVYEEIVEMYGSDHKLSTSDVEKLNYTRAVIDEIQRVASIVPLGLVHCNRKPVTICGYNLPKRSKVIPNIYKLSRDKQFFKNANEFDPNNFLNENGVYAPSVALIPFGIGKRKCLGKRLAEMELWIAFTRLIQHFEWMPPPGEQMKYEVNETFVRTLASFQIFAKQRIHKN